MASFTRRSQAWLARSVLAILAAIAVLSMPAAPVSAHKDHKAKQEAAQLEAQRAAAGGTRDAAPMAHDPAMPGHAAAMAAMDETDDSPQSFAVRMLDWLGRFHPMLVHFPIAFIRRSSPPSSGASGPVSRSRSSSWW